MNREIRRRDGFSRGVHPEESSPSTTTTTTTTAALGTGTGTGARSDGIESSPASVPVDGSVVGSFVGSFVRSFVGIVRDDGFDAVRWFKRTNVAFAFVG